jgi:hypothetical protein
MKIIWKIENSDIKKVKAVYKTQKSNSLVLSRMERNVNKPSRTFSKGIFWRKTLSCLLTTQQRSGPESAVMRFASTKPFPLSYRRCAESHHLRSLVREVITKFGGIRRARSIAGYCEDNLHWLEHGGWETIREVVLELTQKPTVQTERRAAEIVMKYLKGFGPKQSRNLLQDLGLTRYEVPIDSRITKWLTDFGFPVALSATALADSDYYNFVLDGYRRLCSASNIYPCVLDAAIFSSFDNG